jgi:hypothetical protein
MTKDQAELMARLTRAGFTWDDANALRLISMTLHRWAERECGDEHGCISRDEETGKPFWESSWGGKPQPIADREAGALRRLKAIVAKYPGWQYYHQGDCRGASLYMLPPGSVEPRLSLDQYYTRGIAVY